MGRKALKDSCKSEPNEKEPETLAEEANLANALKLTEEPRFMKVKHDKGLPNRTAPRMLKLDPKWACCISDNALPNRVTLRTDNADPKRKWLKTETLAPILAQLVQEMLLPIRASARVLNPEPSSRK
jgi:hypothetical protein